jgi:hypothetical protein
MLEIDREQLSTFIRVAADETYAGGGSYVEKPERPDFLELEYKDGDWYYRDSYSGHSRSGGQEVVRYQEKPVWYSGYGGGMIEGKEELSNVTFEFLKKALSAKEEGFDSLRGPHELVEDDWRYEYEQNGDITSFTGTEKIYYKDELVFFHNTLGGVLNHD